MQIRAVLRLFAKRAISGHFVPLLDLTVNLWLCPALSLLKKASRQTLASSLRLQLTSLQTSSVASRLISQLRWGQFSKGYNLMLLVAQCLAMLVAQHIRRRYHALGMPPSVPDTILVKYDMRGTKKGGLAICHRNCPMAEALWLHIAV